MTDPHDLSAEEAFVQRYLLGACSDEEVTEQLAKNPDLAPRLRELDAVKDLLDGAASEEESVLAEAEKVSFPLGEQRLAEAVQETLRGEAKGPRPLDRRWMMFAAAAAAILLVVLVPDWGGKDDPGPGGDGPSLNQSPVLLHPPQNDGKRWGTFRFDYLEDPQTLPKLFIRVYRGASSQGATLLAESPALTTNEWTFSDATLADWGEELTWQVLSQTPGNQKKVIGRWPAPGE